MSERFSNVPGKVGTFLERVPERVFQAFRNICSRTLKRSGTLWNVPGTARNGGTVFVRASGTLGVSTIALKMTIRQIERDRYLIEKGPIIISLPKSFSPVSDFPTLTRPVPSNIGLLSRQKISNLVMGPCLPGWLIET